MKYVYFTVLMFVVLLPVSCGRSGGDVARGFRLYEPCDNEQQFAANHIDSNWITSAIEEINELGPPLNVEPQVFAELKRYLSEALLARAEDKNICGIPVGNANVPRSVEVTLEQSGDITVSWRGRNAGDYDNNGTVSIPDITPLALNYGANPRIDELGVPIPEEGNEYLANIDGDANGTIGLSDVTPIAMHYGATLTGYRVYMGIQPEGSAEVQWSPSWITPPGALGANRSVSFNPSLEAGEFQSYSFSFSAPGDFLGSLYFRIVATDGSGEGAEYITSEPLVLNTAADHDPPVPIISPPELSAIPSDGQVDLSWGEWTDVQSPPVKYFVFWADHQFSELVEADDYINVGEATSATIADLGNADEYWFMLRVQDSAIPPNIAEPVGPIAATPNPVAVYRMPPPGLYEMPGGEGTSSRMRTHPSPGSGQNNALYEDGAPAAVWISSTGAKTDVVTYCYYDGSRWVATDVNARQRCLRPSFMLYADIPYIVAANLDEQTLDLYTGDVTGAVWQRDVVADVNGEVLRTHVGVQRLASVSEPILFVAYTINGAGVHSFNAAWRLLSGGIWHRYEPVAEDEWMLDVVAPTISGIGEGLIALYTHGTVSPNDMQLDTRLTAARLYSSGGVWELHDISIPDLLPGTENPVLLAVTEDANGDAVLAFSQARTEEVLGYTMIVGVDVVRGLVDLGPDAYGITGAQAVFAGSTEIVDIGSGELAIDWGTFPAFATPEEIAFTRGRGSAFFVTEPEFGVTSGTFFGSIWSWEDGGLTEISVPSGRELAAAKGQVFYVEQLSADVSSIISIDVPVGRLLYYRE